MKRNVIQSETLWLWQVKLGERTVQTVGLDKFHASLHAAFILDVPWTKTACEMDVIRLRPASEYDEREWRETKARLQRERGIRTSGTGYPSPTRRKEKL